MPPNQAMQPTPKAARLIRPLAIMKKCFAKINYIDGRETIEVVKLEHNLPFALTEMEDWLMEKANIKSVKCFANKTMHPTASGG